MSNCVWLMAIVVGAAGPASLPDTSKMNILFINIEDCNASVFGCYGNTICKTPNIDRLAATGVRFDSAYCQAICCNPTRTSFLTGLRPLSTRVLSNSDVMNEHLPPGVLTLPEMLKQRGFYTAVIGKLFHRLDYAERQLATFDRIEMYGRPKGWKGPPPVLKFPPLPKTVRDVPPKDEKSKEYRQWRARHSDRYGDSGLTRQQEHDYRMAATAVALLKEFARSKQQFFLAVAQSRPHTPLVAPREYVAMYDPEKIPDPPAPVEQLRGFPYMQRATGGNPDIFMKGQPTRRQAKEAIAAYYACVTFVDENVGMILDALQQEFHVEPGPLPDLGSDGELVGASLDVVEPHPRAEPELPYPVGRGGEAGCERLLQVGYSRSVVRGAEPHTLRPDLRGQLAASQGVDDQVHLSFVGRDPDPTHDAGRAPHGV